jgi:hypothetical protein
MSTGEDRRNLSKEEIIVDAFRVGKSSSGKSWVVYHGHTTAPANTYVWDVLIFVGHFATKSKADEALKLVIHWWRHIKNKHPEMWWSESYALAKKLSAAPKYWSLYNSR